MTNKINVNNNNWVARDELYSRHCTERGAGYGVWSYRYIITVLPALAVGALAWMVAPHFADPWSSPFTAFMMGFFLTWAAPAVVVELLFAKHQRRVLHRAGIDIPPRRKLKSFGALIRNRKQIKVAYQAFCISHRKPAYHFYSILKYVSSYAHPFSLPFFTSLTYHPLKNHSVNRSLSLSPARFFCGSTLSL